jgi:hypothetical protein
MYIGADVCTYPHLAGMAQAAQKMGKSGNCVAALVYVYDHTARDSAVRPVVLFSLPPRVMIYPWLARYAAARCDVLCRRYVKSVS